MLPVASLSPENLGDAVIDVNQRTQTVAEENFATCRLQFTRNAYLCPRKFQMTYGGFLSNAQIFGDASRHARAPRPDGRGGLESAPDRHQRLPRDR